MELTLTVSYNKTEQNITDKYGNKLTFTDGVLTKTTPCYNELMYNTYAYSDGRLVSISNSNKEFNKINFQYEGGLLKKLVCAVGGKTERVITYFYDEDMRLVRIRERVGDSTRDVAYFVYDENDCLTYAVDAEDKSAVKLEYEYGKVKKASVGVATVEFSGPSSFTVGGVSEIDNDLDRYNNFEYVNRPEDSFGNHGEKYTAVTNESGLKNVYYYNLNGELSSVLEAHGGNINDVRALEKSEGVLFLNGTTPSAQTINGRNVISIAANANKLLQTEYTESSPELSLSALSDYRRKKCAYFKRFTVGMWVKLHRAAQRDAYIRVSITGSGSGKGKLDGSAVESWQYVRIPLYLNKDGVDGVVISSRGIESAEIADVRLQQSGGTSAGVSIERYNADEISVSDPKFASVDDLDGIEYYPENLATPTVQPLGGEYYMSDKDWQSTLENMDENGKTILSMRDCTVRLHVDKIIVKALGMVGIKFEKVDYIIKRKRGDVSYQRRVYSPYGGVTVTDQLMFDVWGRDKTYTCLKTVASSESANSETLRYIDEYGRIVKEIDEYGIQTLYEYDGFGLVCKKTVWCASDEEKLNFLPSTTTEKIEYYTSNTDEKTEQKDKYNSFIEQRDIATGNVIKTERKGLADTDGETVDYGYDLYKTRLTTVSGNERATSRFTYDDRGRLSAVKADGGYNFGFGYDGLGMLCSVSRIIGENESSIVSTNERNRSNFTVTEKKYRGNTPDTTEISLDSYGRTTQVRETSADGNEYVTEYKYQTSGESESVSEVTEMYDPYEQTTHTYTYDSNNDLIAYGNGKVSIAKVYFDEDRYAYAGMEYITKTKYDESKLMSPRLIRLSPLCPSDKSIEYGYDGLGRIAERKESVASYEFLQTTTEYVPGTTLKAKEETVHTAFSDSGFNGFTCTQEYNAKGLLSKETVEYGTRYSDSDNKSYERQFTYDRAYRLASVKDEKGTMLYTYAADGSLLSERLANGLIMIDHISENGRLKTIEKIDVQSSGYEKKISNYDYDNLGNCTHYNSSEQNLYWERGSLLNRNATANADYSYNSAGVRFRKKVGDKTTEYYLDGDKILAEITGNKMIRYLYDGEGVCGFTVKDKNTRVPLYECSFLKDSTNNVIAILREDKIVAEYFYDAWGSCTVQKDIDGIGTMNPIRWKSLYYDEESKFYYINGRYYSPDIKRYISPLNPEAAISNYGINLYALDLTNPITAVYNEHTAAAGLTLKYEPEAISDWERFWMDVQHIIFGKWMKVAALGTLLLGFVLACVCPSFAPIFLITLGCVGLTLTIGGIVAGIQNGEKNGGFQRGFVNYINDYWAFTLASEMLIAMACFGISKAVAAIGNAGAKKPATGTKTEQAVEPQQITEPTQTAETFHLSSTKTSYEDLFEALGVKDFYEAGKKYTPQSLEAKLAELNYTKSISYEKPHSPATVMTSPDGQTIFRIQPINPQHNTPYFRVRNAYDNYLSANGTILSDVSKKQFGDLTHFIFRR